MMPLGAPSISKYGSLVRPDAQIVALRAHCALHCARTALEVPPVTGMSCMCADVSGTKNHQGEKASMRQIELCVTPRQTHTCACVHLHIGERKIPNPTLTALQQCWNSVCMCVWCKNVSVFAGNKFGWIALNTGEKSRFEIWVNLGYQMVHKWPLDDQLAGTVCCRLCALQTVRLRALQTVRLCALQTVRLCALQIAENQLQSFSREKIGRQTFQINRATTHNHSRDTDLGPSCLVKLHLHALWVWGEGGGGHVGIASITCSIAYLCPCRGV